MYKNVWFFYTMFQFEKLEQWLEQMAREGWVYTNTKYWYRFEFKKSPYPVYLAYRVDYRAFQLDGYLNDLQKQGWAIYKLSKYWSVCSKGYATNKPPVLKTNYDEDTLPYLRKSRIWQIAVTILCFTAPMFLHNSVTNPVLLRVMCYIMGVMTLYQMARISLYQTMIEVRQQL